jgi:hypothetical protein
LIQGQKPIIEESNLRTLKASGACLGKTTAPKRGEADQEAAEEEQPETKNDDGSTSQDNRRSDAKDGGSIAGLKFAWIQDQNDHEPTSGTAGREEVMGGDGNTQDQDRRIGKEYEELERERLNAALESTCCETQNNDDGRGERHTENGRTKLWRGRGTDRMAEFGQASGTRGMGEKLQSMDARLLGKERLRDDLVDDITGSNNRPDSVCDTPEDSCKLKASGASLGETTPPKEGGKRRAQKSRETMMKKLETLREASKWGDNYSRGNGELRANNAENLGERLHSPLPTTRNQDRSGDERSYGEGESRNGGNGSGIITSTAEARKEHHKEECAELRTLSLPKSDDVKQIWEWAEERLSADRSNFALVYSGHKYLPQEGKLETPVQLFEIRWRGVGGARTKIQQGQEEDVVEDLVIAVRMMKAAMRKTQKALSKAKGGVLDKKRAKQEKKAETLAVDIQCDEVRLKVKYSSKWQKMKRRIKQVFHLKWKRWVLFKWIEERSEWEKLPPPYGALEPNGSYKLVIRSQDVGKKARPGKLRRKE